MNLQTYELESGGKSRMDDFLATTPMHQGTRLNKGKMFRQCLRPQEMELGVTTI